MKHSIPTVKRKSWSSALMLALVLALVISLVQSLGNNQDKQQLITVSTLKQIINVSELSTFTAVYNGIAEVKNTQNPEEIDYYVSYEAQVNAGIDFEKISISVDPEQKEINMILPDVYITDLVVDIASLDFIFLNSKANTSSVTQEAFKACEADVQQESEQQPEIYSLAKQSAVNVLTALTKPIIEQLDSAYTLVIH